MSLTTQLPAGKLYAPSPRCLSCTGALCARQQGDWKLGKAQGERALTWKNQWHVSPMMGNPMEPLGMGSLQLLSRVAVHLSCQSCWDTARRSAMDTKHAASVASAETRSKLSKSMAVNVRGLVSNISLEWWALKWLNLKLGVTYSVRYDSLRQLFLKAKRAELIFFHQKATLKGCVK